MRDYGFGYLDYEREDETTVKIVHSSPWWRLEQEGRNGFRPVCDRFTLNCATREEAESVGCSYQQTTGKASESDPASFRRCSVKIPFRGVSHTPVLTNPPGLRRVLAICHGCCCSSRDWIAPARGRRNMKRKGAGPVPSVPTRFYCSTYNARLGYPGVREGCLL